MPGHPLHDAALSVNPYVTVDWIPIALSVFNSGLLPGEIGDWDDTEAFDPDDPDFDRAFSYADSKLNLASVESTGRHGELDPVSKMLYEASNEAESFSDYWGLEARSNRQRPAFSGQRPPLQLGHSIGTVPNATVLQTKKGRVTVPRPWVAWRNRAFANHLDLLNVPKSSSARFRYEFSTLQTNDDEATSASVKFGHLLDFTAKSPFSQALRRLLEFVEVPDVSRARQTDQVSTAPRHAFRDAAKINVNTIQDRRVWSAIGAEHFVPWSRVETSRRANAFQTLFEANGLMRDDPLHAERPLLLPDVTNDVDRPSRPGRVGLHNNPARNSHFYFQGYQKLARLLTTQSNVFGVWVTIGYFEVEPNYPRVDGVDDYEHPNHVDPTHPDGLRWGVERGAELGNVRRHRGFFVVDRSIPVAFEPGVNHNVQDAIVLRRYLE